MEIQPVDDCDVCLEPWFTVIPTCRQDIVNSLSACCLQDARYRLEWDSGRVTVLQGRAHNLLPHDSLRHAVNQQIASHHQTFQIGVNAGMACWYAAGVIDITGDLQGVIT
eukprot:753625-Hanusia_phi.AAC.3